MKKIITYVMIFTMLITTAAVSMAVPASASVKKQSKRQVTLIRSYNKIYRKCKKNFKYDGPQLEMNQDSYKEFKIWDKELNRVYKLLYKGLSAKQKKVLKKKQIRWIKKKEKEAAKEAAQWAGGSGQPLDRKSTRLNSSHTLASRMPSSA